MEIDSFYANNDMSFGMDGRISFANEYANAKGSSGPTRVEQVASWYPLSDDCKTIENTIQSIVAEIDSNNAKLANPKVKKAEKRVVEDYQKALNAQRLRLEDKYRTLDCKLEKQKAQDQAFLSQLGATVGGASQSGDSGKKPTNILVYVGVGVGVVALLGTILYIAKKK
jgi:hypothetical protein